MNNHKFSIFFENIELFFNKKNNIFEIKDKNLINRIINVLRLNVCENFIIFNFKFEYLLNIKKIEKNLIFCEIKDKKLIEKNEKKIFLYLPIIAKEKIEEILYICGQQNINIIFVKYEKSYRKINLKENLERFNKIIISGCEQGKQYEIPKIFEKEIEFFEMIKQINENEQYFFYCDFDWKKLIDFNFSKFIKNDFYFTSGPEAGFSKKEKELLNNFNCFKLSDYTLRSVDTINFISILLRSLWILIIPLENS